MADHINFKVSITPVEELIDENGNTVRTISGEVGRSLGGSGDSVNIANYGGSAATQGYANATVNYADATHSAGGTQIGAAARDVYFIKNTGHKFSSVIKLGDSTTDCVMVVVRESAHSASSTGGYRNSSNADEIHFYEIAWLKPGQAIILPCSASNLSITQFGSNSNDLSPIGQTGSAGQWLVFLRTFQLDGTAATDGNAVEFLSVT